MSDPDGRIEVSGLTKSFGTVTAVDNLSFTVEPGRVTGFLGSNGAGKTTTLRMILGLVKPDAGYATIGGHSYTDLVTPASVVGAALEATGFHPARTGRDHLRVYCTVSGLTDERADTALHEVGLANAGNRKVGGYSLGMRQRLALATALLGDPAALVLDEPANGLDPEGIAWMRRLLRGLADHGKAILVSSHLLAELQQLVDDVVILNRGQLVHQSTLEELAGGSQPVTLVRTPDVDSLAGVLASANTNGTNLERTSAEGLTVVGMTATEIGHAAWHAGVELHELTPRRSGLEDLFFTLTNTRTEETPAP